MPTDPTKPTRPLTISHTFELADDVAVKAVVDSCGVPQSLFAFTHGGYQLRYEVGANYAALTTFARKLQYALDQLDQKPQALIHG